ncbi:MAG: hypothetical protein CMB99_05230 [Flavobacteriaceae bacterium]|nr:hypothetical protein [Flavobacteriaceae bacterium]|tara:strand:+ start:57108 stop:58211 length:1104 start_codon:yes stop_codon:yes gene_type:complete
MKKVLFMLGLLPLLFGCNSESKKSNQFELELTLNGVKDSSLVIIEEPKQNGKIIDSARIFNNKLSFKGEVSGSEQVILRVDGTRDYKYFWLEPNKMTLTAETGKFRQAKITGSKIQLKQDELANRVKPLEDLMDQVDGYAQINYKSLSKEQIDSLRTILNKAQRDVHLETQKFIAENSSSTYGIYLLEFYKTTYGKEVVKDLFLKFDKELQAGSYGKSISRYLIINDEPQIGEKYQDVKLPNLDGELSAISDIEAEYLLIEFWASNCAPCRITNPKLVKIHEKYKSKGFEIYGISLDVVKQDWLDAVKKDGLTWENVVDLDGEEGDVALTYGINGIPVNYLVNKEGTILAKNIWSEQLEAFLKKSLP